MVLTFKEDNLLTAIIKGSISEINQAIQDGANVNAKANDGWTPLMLALFSEASKEVIELLIAKGAKVNAKTNDDWTPLMYACTYKVPKEVIELLKKAEKAQFTALKANLAKSEQKNAKLEADLEKSKQENTNLQQKIDEQNAQIAYNNFQAKKKEKKRMTYLMLGKYRHR